MIMVMSRGFDHLKRPKMDRMWCGLPWRKLRDTRLSKGKREICPDCLTRSKRGK